MQRDRFWSHWVDYFDFDFDFGLWIMAFDLNNTKEKTKEVVFNVWLVVKRA